MAQTMLYVNEHAHVDALGPDAGLDDDQIPSFEPGAYPVITCANGDQVLVAGHPAEKGNFADWVAITGFTHLLHDERFATIGSRRRHVRELNAELAAWGRTMADGTAVEAAVDHVKFAVGQVRTMSSLADSDWAEATGALVPVSDRRGGTIRLPQAPWRFSDAEVGITPDDAPAFRGEHNRSVLQRLLGIDDAELDRLEADGVLSSRLPRPG